jgi:hypothetical protein
MPDHDTQRPTRLEPNQDERFRLNASVRSTHGGPLSSHKAMRRG